MAAFVRLLVASLLALGVQHASAQSSSPYPAKAVRMVIPLAPGGGSDIVGRIVAHALTEGRALGSGRAHR